MHFDNFATCSSTPVSSSSFAEIISPSKSVKANLTEDKPDELLTVSDVKQETKTFTPPPSPSHTGQNLNFFLSGRK